MHDLLRDFLRESLCEAILRLIELHLFGLLQGQDKVRMAHLQLSVKHFGFA